MWSLILFMVLGVYLWGKLTAEKVSVNKYRAEYEEGNRQASDFFRKYSASFEEYNDIEKSISEGSEDIQKFSSELAEIIKMEPTYPMIIWGVLAQKGKVPPELYVTTSGNLLSNMHDLAWKDITIWKDIHIKDMRAARLRFLIWYDNTLRSQGMKEKLLFVPWDEKNGYDGATRHIFYLEDVKQIQECENIYPTVVFWRPITQIAMLISGENLRTKSREHYR